MSNGNEEHYPREAEPVNKDGSLIRWRTSWGWIIVSDLTRVDFPRAYNSTSIGIAYDIEHKWKLEDKR